MAAGGNGAAPFVLFYASVLASAWVGGLGPGLFTTALGAAVGAYFFCEPRYSFDIASPTHVMRLGVFVMEGVLLSLFGTTIFTSRERARKLELEAGSAREEVRQGEQRLREARGRIVEQALLLDQARDAIFLQDLSGKITYWNQGAERCYGWGAADALGLEPAALLFPPAQASPLADGGRALSERGQWQGDLILATRQGGEVIVEARLAKVFDEAGQPRGVLHIANDVTHRKKLVESAVTAAGEVVLVLDHEASMRELARGALEAHGYRVLATAPPELSLPTKVAGTVRVVMIRPYSAEELLRTVGEVLRDKRTAGMPEPERVS